ncbi:MAG: hypothetical protein K6A44_03685 [bacterium]|nr:hypothetical protein [bacterium]
MKKIIIALLFIFAFSLNALATENLSFVYINGSNNNDDKMRNWYEKGVHKLHPVMRKKFLTNSAIRKHYKDKGNISIKKEPVVFFWGYDSRNDLNFVKDNLEVSKMVSSVGAYFARNIITQCLHDAIWVQKSHNMLPILDDLNDTVLQEAKQGNKVILYGYSAGTFITYGYLMNKMRYIDLKVLLRELNADSDIIEAADKLPLKKTCMSALSLKNGNIGTMSTEGHLVLNGNEEKLKASLAYLNDVTDRVCAPEGMVVGIVNFACPLVLFYSDIADEDYDFNYYNRLMIKYIMENGIFMITANFSEDPLGFPMSKNLTISDIEKNIGLKINNPTGVIYDNSGIWSKRMFPFAHTAYWNARGTFSKAVVQSIVNGYKFQYNEKYQSRVIKRNKKKSEL